MEWDRPCSVYECQSCGFHFLDALDGNAGEASVAELTTSDEDYIRNSLQSNSERFQWQMDVLKTFVPHPGASVLDVGAGGGLFLHLARGEGMHVMGSEPSSVRAQFALKEYGLTLNREVVNHPMYDKHVGTFDAVTLWDVIEHVDDPRKLLKRCKELLKPGGVLLMDTPARDSLFYQSGEFSYTITGGRLPFLLKTMYSPARFGHKQIFRLSEMTGLLIQMGFDILESRKFYELSFPRKFYLRRLLRSEIAVRCADPVARALLAILPVKNKMLVVARA